MLYFNVVILMKVKIFDFEHELDLEQAINNYFSEVSKNDLIDIKYCTSHFSANGEQIYSFSALIILK